MSKDKINKGGCTKTLTNKTKTKQKPFLSLPQIDENWSFLATNNENKALEMSSKEKE